MKKKLFSILLCLAVVCGFISMPVDASAEEGEWSAVTSVQDGGTYLFASANSMTDKSSKTYQSCVVKSVQSSDSHGLAYCERPTDHNYADDCLWTLEAASNGQFYMKSVKTGKYLNMKASTSGNGKGSAVMSSTRQALTIAISGGAAKISATLNGVVYYIRFTNTYDVSVWEAATADGSNRFTVYGIFKPDLDEYENTTDPLFSVACFADLHVDYGIQSYTTPVRPGTIKAANYVKDVIGAADVALVGGDMTSNNGNKTWNTTNLQKTKDTIYNTIATATKDGKVMFVSGNHENEAGVQSNSGYSSGDYSKYMTDNIGKYKATLYFNEMGVGTSPYNELLCYRYEVNNIEFIGINTPYRNARGDGYTYLEQIDWLEKQLKDIGKDETVVVFCHYPINTIVNAPGQTGASTKMSTVLSKYPNVLYCYGHVHHGTETYAAYSSSELVVPNLGATKLSNNAYQTNSFINVHMGSMGYYKTQYAPNEWLGEAEPVINQLLMIDFYEDHITFKYYNTGEKTAVEGVTNIASYTVMRDLSAQLGDGEGSGSGSAGGSGSGSGSAGGSGSGSTDSSASSSSTTSDSVTTDSQGTSDNTTTVTDSQGAPNTDGVTNIATSDGNGNPASADGLPTATLILLIAGGVFLLAGVGLALWYFLAFSKKK